MNEIQTSFAFQVPDHHRVISNHSHLRFGRSILLIVGAFCFNSSLLEADQSGDFTYTDTGTSITITDYPESAVGEVQVPELIAGKPVTAIGPNAFSLCAGVTSVTLPSGLTTIGSQAFFNCTALTAVSIPGTVTSIGDSAFYSCIMLSSVTIPAGMTSISNGTFDSCRALTSLTIPMGVTTIGNNAFYNCNALPSLAIPSTVKSIGAFAFAYCSGLTSLEIPSGVTAINASTFADCTNLMEVQLPSGVTSIGASAFGNCTSLATLALPSTVSSIGPFAFTKCSALTSMVIPSGVVTIGTSTFEFCSLLASVTLPPTVSAIGDNAFRYCSSLLGIEITATTTTTIGTDAFGSCSSLTSINVNPSNPSFSSVDGVLFTKSKLTLHTYPRGRTGPYVIPASVTNIRANSFRFCVGVTSIQIPAATTTIGLEAFSGCSALTSFSVHANNPNFKSVGGILFTKSGLSLFAYPSGLSGAFSIPLGVTNITVSAFRYSAALTSVTLPSSITTVGDNAFGNCAQLSQATFAGNAPPNFGAAVFQSAAPGFTVFFNPGTINFTTPTWQTYPSQMLTIVDPYLLWLLSYGLPVDSEFNADSNRDGVSLLMAYALDLDPKDNLAGSLPKPVITGNQMSLSYHTGSVGVTYFVEACTNFTDWTTEGVTLSDPDENQVQTATVNLTGGNRFMRLVAVY